MVRMRADRLLRIVFRLQGAGVVSASALARELEVSTRTIRRDMEALSTAGVPVYSVRGSAGGWALTGNYRTTLTGLTTSEALATIVGQTRDLLPELGLDDPGEGLVMKLLAAVDPNARGHAEHARQRIHVDLRGYWEPVAGDPPALLPGLLQASWHNRVVGVRYGTASEPTRLEPYGLVRKGIRWYLVAARDGTVRTYRVSRIHALTVTDERFTRPADFDLRRHWQRAQADYASGFASYPVRLRVRGDALARAGWAYARSRSMAEPDADGWVEARFDTEDWDGALALALSLGRETEVLEPAELRAEVHAAARSLVTLNG